MKTSLTIILLALTLLHAPTTNAGNNAYPPQNAADLYRKAFKLYQPDSDMKLTLTHLTIGKVELDQSIIKQVSANKKVIDIALEASKIENCDWGFKYSAYDPADPNESLNELMDQSDNFMSIRRIVFLILADARIKAQTSQINIAIDEVFASYAVSRHVDARSTHGYLITTNLELLIDNVLTDILSEHELNSTMLNYIERHLDHHIKTRHHLKKTFDFETQYGLDAINKVSPKMVKEQFEYSIRKMEDDPNFADEFIGSDEVKYRDLDPDYFLRHRQELRKTIDMPYPKAIAAIDEINDAVLTDFTEIGQADQDFFLVNSTVFMINLAVPPLSWGKYYTSHVKAMTRFNALLTAIEIYKIKARTGKLSDQIPLRSPKDLFSGKDFIYEKTETGFILRCRAKDLSKDTIHEYEFKVAK